MTFNVLALYLCNHWCCWYERVDHLGMVQVCVVVPIFFFFQAEDGIRDLTVTGVQTCALPIWPLGRLDARPRPVRRGGEAMMRARARARGGTLLVVFAVACGRRDSVPDAAERGRSEERRVGKGCRSRWSPDH